MQLPPDPTTETNVSLFPEIDLKVYARILWHWAWLIILCIVLAATSAYVASLLTVPIYRATSTLLIDQAQSPQANMQDLLLSERIARTYAQLMQRKKLLDTVAQKLGVEPDVLTATIANISVTPTRDTQLVQVSVEGTSPELTAWVANQLPLVFIEEINGVQTGKYADSKGTLEAQLNDLKSNIDLDNAQIDSLGGARTPDEEIRLSQLREELSQYQASYTSLLGRYEDLRLAELQSTDSITVVDEAIEPQTPIRPRVLTNTLLAAIVGAMLALGVIFLVEYLDDRIRTPQDLQSVLDVPILGTIARMGSRRRQQQLTREESLIVATQPRHPVTEAYRRLRTNLRFSSVNEPLHTLLVTSAIPGEGKTTTAANLATTVAQSGYRVVIIDADLRKPQIHKLFNLSKGPGLTDALLSGGEATFFLRNSGMPNLQVLTCGSIPPNPAELLGSKPMQRLLQQLQNEVDFVIIDAPPLLAVTDAQILAGHVQGVLLIVNANSTSRALVASAATALLQVEARLLGVVLNQLTRSARSYYYYDAYTDYYAEQDEEDLQANSSVQAGIPLEPIGITSATKPPLQTSSEGDNHPYDLQDTKTTNGKSNGFYQLNPTQDR